MDERLLRVSMALNELIKYRTTNVLIGEPFQAVVEVLNRLNIDCEYKSLDENYNTIFLKE